MNITDALYRAAHADPQIQDTLRLIGVVLGLIHLRLPALAEKLQMRVGPASAPPSLWTSPEHRP